MRLPFMKYLKLLLVLGAVIAANGCASVTRYSIESYQGPLLSVNQHATTPGNR